MKFAIFHFVERNVLYNIFAAAHIRKFHRDGKGARIMVTWCNTSDCIAFRKRFNKIVSTVVSKTRVKFLLKISVFFTLSF